jgi:hypothetical protein
MTEVLALPCIQCGRPAEPPSDYCAVWPRCIDPAPHTPEFSTMGDGVERSGRSGNVGSLGGMGWAMTRPPPPPQPAQTHAPEADEGNG